MGAEPTYGVFPCPSDAPLFRHRYDPTNRGYIIPWLTFDGQGVFLPTDGYVLTADSTQVWGYSWQPASGGGGSANSYGTQVLDNSDVTFTPGMTANYWSLSGTLSGPVVITLADWTTGDKIANIQINNVVTTGTNTLVFQSAVPTTLLTLNDSITQHGNLVFAWTGSDWALFSERLT